jgi:poly(rC)-binding protein 2/3/4
MGLLSGPVGFQGGLGNTRITTKEIVINNDMVGSIIGRQGSRINEIRQTSGASIKIAEAEDGSSERKVIITGAQPCVKSASYLIKNLCSKYKASKE